MCVLYFFSGHGEFDQFTMADVIKYYCIGRAMPWQMLLPYDMVVDVKTTEDVITSV